MNKPDQTQLTLITLLATVQILHETLDDLKDTVFYKQSFKAATNKFETALTLTCDPLINKITGLDEKTMIGIQEGISHICKEMAHMNPARLAAIGELFKQSKIEFLT